MSTVTLQIIQYGQEVTSGGFNMYDFGEEENMQVISILSSYINLKSTEYSPVLDLRSAGAASLVRGGGEGARVHVLGGQRLARCRGGLHQDAGSGMKDLEY